MNRDQFHQLFREQSRTGAAIVVTYDTRDYPGKYVARLHEFVGAQSVPTAHHMIASTIDEIRKLRPVECNTVNRTHFDDPVIVEWWM